MLSFINFLINLYNNFLPKKILIRIYIQQTLLFICSKKFFEAELIEAKGIDVEAVLHSHFYDEVSDSSGIVEVVRVQDASCQPVLHRLERVFGLFEAVDDLRDPGVNVEFSDSKLQDLLPGFGVEEICDLVLKEWSIPSLNPQIVKEHQTRV